MDPSQATDVLEGEPTHLSKATPFEVQTIDTESLRLAARRAA